jgi:hypothetical protein
MKETPFEWLSRKWGNVTYPIRCFFKPYNVIKCAKLDRSWCDRDHLMLHAMFQILVDFVELEQPFRDWNRKTKRYTDRNEMRAWIEKSYNTPEGRASFYCDWHSDDEKVTIDERTRETYLTATDVLNLYEWYKDEKYEFDTWTEIEINKVPGQRIYEMELAHNEMVNNMLRKLLACREWLWT